MSGDVQAGVQANDAGGEVLGRPFRDGPKQHELKVSFCHLMDALLDGTKTFEVRRNDRDFRVGDVLWLREWGTGGHGYSGRHLKKRVLFIYSADNDLGLGMLDENVVVMALGAMPSYRSDPYPQPAASPGVSPSTGEPKEVQP